MYVMKTRWLALAALLLVWVGGPATAQTQGQACPPTASYTQELLTKAAQQARNRGFLWRIQRDGKSSYLYGSLHVGKAEWMSPGPEMRMALNRVDTVALEVDMTSEEAQQQFQQINRQPQRAIPPALSKRLERLWLAECLPLEQLKSGPVELQATALVALMGRRQGFDPAYSSEFMLIMLAKASKLPVVSLESLKSQVDLVLAASDAQAAEMVSGMLEQLEKPQTREMQEKLTLAWEHNDLDVLERYQDWCDCVHTERERADMKKLLDDRNPGLADGIERLHASGQRVFAAVGALHMTGPLALPRLLAARGFTVERVY
jgi:uncharacterized protein YbaP (TraB family)